MDQDSGEQFSNGHVRSGTRRLLAPGRRKTDFDARTTLTKKFVAVVTIIVNLAVLIGEALLRTYDVCP